MDAQPAGGACVRCGQRQQMAAYSSTAALRRAYDQQPAELQAQAPQPTHRIISRSRSCRGPSSVTRNWQRML